MDPDLFVNMDPATPLIIDVTLWKLNKVEDLYRDGLVFYKTVRSGEGTGQPYYDCRVVLKVNIEIDGKQVFCHQDPLGIELTEEAKGLSNEFYACYDLEEYTLPAVIRKLLKTTKRHQIRTVRCRRLEKLSDHLDDPNGVFTLARMQSVQDECIITYSLVDFEQKEYPFKVSVSVPTFLVTC